jgi:RHS repeat-associated protein
VLAQRQRILVTNTPTATNTPTRTSTPTSTNAAIDTPTPTTTSTPTNTPTNTYTPTNTHTPTPTNTPTNTPTPQMGLKGEYYNQVEFGEAAMVRYDTTIDFVWGEGSPSMQVNEDEFSVQWTGRVKTPNGDNTGTYVFMTNSDEGVRLWVDDELIVDNWTAHEETGDSGQIYLQANQEYSIRIEYYEGSGNATMQLSWKTPDHTSEIIPYKHLLPPLPPAQTPTPKPTYTGTPDPGPGPNQTISEALVYLHTDHLGSISMATSGEAPATVLSRQTYDPWGKVRTGGVSETKLNFTGQKLDDTGLLYYRSRYYDPVLARFVSADTIVPGASSGVGGAGGTVGKEQNSKLTVDFHETGFLTSVQGENSLMLKRGFWFQLSDRDKQKARQPWGPQNPQALSRYAYVLNNPLRYVDPTGHYILIRDYDRMSVTLILNTNEINAILLAIAGGVAVATAVGAVVGAIALSGGTLAPVIVAIMGLLVAQFTLEMFRLGALSYSGGALAINCSLEHGCNSLDLWGPNVPWGGDYGPIPDGDNQYSCRNGQCTRDNTNTPPPPTANTRRPV